MPKPPHRLRAAAPRSPSLPSNEWRVERFGEKSAEALLQQEFKWDDLLGWRMPELPD